MDVLTSQASAEIVVKRSRFLAELIPCQTTVEAREILKSQKDKYRDASHVVHAFICGLGAENCGMSDDGEPSGTAGKPVFAVLKGRGCTNAMLTVTRWFGGTLLGTGGLVKAYGDSAKAVIASADADGLFEEYIAKREFVFTLEYSQHEKIKQLLKSFTIYDLQENFSSGVEMKLKVKEEDAVRLTDMLCDSTNGKVDLRAH